MNGDEPIGGYYGPREIVIMVAIPLLIIGILYFAAGGFSGLQDLNTYYKMKVNMDTSQQITHGIVTDMDCPCAYGFGVAIGGERYWFDLSDENVPLLSNGSLYTIYWHWDVVEYCAGGCCRYARYVDYIEDRNGDRVSFAIKWYIWEEEYIGRKKEIKKDES